MVFQFEHIGLDQIEGKEKWDVYEGKVDMEFVDGEKYQLNKGDFLPFDARIEHNVIARCRSKVLVTISESLT